MPLLCGLSFSVTSITTAHAALSATTANTIQGTKPYIIFNGVAATNLDELLSFDMPDGLGGTTSITAAQTAAIDAEPSWTFSQFTAKVTADGADKNLSTFSWIMYADDDGDDGHVTSPVTGTLKATWSYIQPDGTTKILTATDLATTFDACNAPYTLTIEASGVAAQSAHGDPIDNVYANATKAYTVNVSDYRFCYAKPWQMKSYTANQWMGIDSSGQFTSWNDPNNTTRHPLNGGGYSSDFVPGGGFKASATTKFPTTGFVKAVFQLVMSNSQDDYTFVSSQPGAVSVSNSGSFSGTVTLNSKPSGAVTITATPKNSSYPPVTYTFNPTTLWVVPKQGVSGWSDAYAKCGGIANVLTRAELTNSPRNTALPGWTYVDNGYTRAIDGSLLSEWGWIGYATYAETDWLSPFQSHYYFYTQDVNTTGNSAQFIVFSSSGGVNDNNGGHGVYVACRG